MSGPTQKEGLYPFSATAKSGCVEFTALSPSFRVGRPGRQVKIPVRCCRPALRARLPACRGEEGAPVLRPGLPAAARFARKTAAGAAEAARRGGERGAAGAGTAPALFAAHLPTAGQYLRRKPRGAPRISGWTEGLPLPARWEGPRHRKTVGQGPL